MSVWIQRLRQSVKNTRLRKFVNISKYYIINKSLRQCCQLVDIPSEFCGWQSIFKNKNPICHRVLTAIAVKRQTPSAVRRHVYRPCSPVHELNSFTTSLSLAQIVNEIHTTVSAAAAACLVKAINYIKYPSIRGCGGLLQFFAVCLDDLLGRWDGFKPGHPRGRDSSATKHSLAFGEAGGIWCLFINMVLAPNRITIRRTQMSAGMWPFWLFIPRRDDRLKCQILVPPVVAWSASLNLNIL